METLAQVLEKTIKKLPQARRIKEQIMLDSWADVVGKEIAQRSSPLYIDSGCMTVLVQDSAWAQHLSMQRKKIVYALNRKAKTNILKDIRFKADGRVLQSRMLEEEKKAAGSWKNETVPGEEQEMLQQMIDRENTPPELREALFHYLVGLKKKKKWFFSQGFIPCRQCESPLLPGSMEGEIRLCLSCRQQAGEE